MKQADDMAILKHVDQKRLASTSRLVVQTSEDAREISVKHIDEERAAAGHEADENRVASANAEARSAKDQAADADRARADADSARENADRKTYDAQESARNAAAGQAQAERDAATAQQGQQAAQAESDQNKAAAMSSDQKLQQALREREELRARLLIQFNAILETRDTARGLVVNMSDVLFDSAKFTLRPAAREKLAKISGIILGYPTLSLAIEGNTDSVGGDAYNQTLSENRADSVRDYLGQEGIPSASMTAHGFGKNQPVASNDTADGRQQNRRVELVVSGEVIGNVVGTGPAAMETLPLAPQQ
jgi:outer membrane protein OmpA-like peptidoglycan-associated protein